jgi:elongation factor G
MAARSAVASRLRKANEKSANVLMEPVMQVTVFVNEGSLGSVVQDLSSARGGQVLSLDSSGSPSQSSDKDADLPTINPAQIYTPPDPFATSTNTLSSDMRDSQRQIVARVPLKEMVGYLNHLRALTGGRGTFVMSVDGFERMASQRQKEVLEAMREFG